MSATEPKSRSNVRPDELAAIDPSTGLVNCVIEAPQHSRCKFKFSEQEGLYRLDKLLPLGASFPYAFGFVPSTVGEDGDPLDVLIVADEPLFTGCVVSVRLIGILEAEQTDGDGKTVRNDRLIGVVQTKLNPPDATSIDELPGQKLDEIEHFFVSYNEMEGRRFQPLGRKGPERAYQLVEQSRNTAGGPHSGTDQDGSQRMQTKPQTKPQRNTSGNSDPKADSSDGKQREDDQAKDAPSKSFSLQADESFRKGIHRIIRRQFKRALKDLEDKGEIDTEAVHAIRKRFKRLRAVLRLTRSGLGTRVFRRENITIRDAGRVLTDLRNAKVLVEALDKLKENEPARVPGELFDDIERFLNARLGELHEQLIHDSIAFSHLRKTVAHAADRLPEYSLPRDGSKVVRCALRREYDRGREAFEAAQADPTVPNLHEWRKQAKYLYYELQIIQRLAKTGKVVDSLHRLTQLLGDDHDLAMLRDEVQGCAERGLHHPVDPLLQLIDEKRGELQHEAFEIGTDVYRDQEDDIVIQIREWSRSLKPKARVVA